MTSSLARASHGSNQTAGPAAYRPPGETDIHLFREGTHARLFETLGARMCQLEGVAGAAFGVWAPNAAQIAVIGDFNGWDASACLLSPRPDGSGIWEGFTPDARLGQRYKYRITSRYNDYVVDKADPFAFQSEVPPSTASVLCDVGYEWHDNEWMTHRRGNNALDQPMSVYEVHLGSWRRVPEDNFRSLHYREIAEPLAQHVLQLGFTHVEFMPVMEHPFFGSWGYQVTGFFAPSARYGSPQDLMYLIDTLHAYGIGVILDWVPSHFPDDAHGIAYFDGTYLFEHADPRQGVHPEWKSRIFNYGRNEVRAFLLSSATYWLEKFHVDALRVDGVASMLYLDYGRNAGEWIPNAFGGRENLEAVSFLRALNEAVYRDFPDTQMMAEESTAWPMVSRPIYIGGLGFGLKWNMGWMHDTLNYFGRDPIYRKYHHDQLTFGIWYAFHENFVLPLSHDEVVYGKGSLLRRMPGDDWQRFANLRLLFGFMWGHPGKKLLFMGGEFGQYAEWNHDGSLDWHLREYPLHAGVERWLGDLNAFYREHPALYQRDFSSDGFAWIDCHDAEQSVVSFMRRAADGSVVVIVCNNTPTVRENYRVGVPVGGVWHERLNSDAPLYGGSGQGNLGAVEASPVAAHGHYWSLTLRLPPLGVLYLIPDGPTET